MAKRLYTVEEIAQVRQRLSMLSTQIEALKDTYNVTGLECPLYIDGEAELRRGLQAIAKWAANGHTELSKGVDLLGAPFGLTAISKKSSLGA